MGTIPEVAIALFRTPPDRFVAERDALVKELRAQGRDDDAATVKALRKPSATVWALNQLAERESEALATLFETGRALRAAQSDAIAGSSSAALVEAGAERRAAAARLTTAAVAILDEGGHRGAAQSDAIALALEAAAVDPDLGAELAGGTLEKLPTAGGDMGFGGVPPMTALTGGAGTRRRPAVRRAPRRRGSVGTRHRARGRGAPARGRRPSGSSARGATRRARAPHGSARRGRVGRAGGRARGGTGRAYRRRRRGMTGG